MLGSDGLDDLRLMPRQRLAAATVEVVIVRKVPLWQSMRPSGSETAAS